MLLISCGAPGPTDAGVDAGVDGGADAGLDAGSGCASGMFWTDGVRGAMVMEPGLACRACHLGNNFAGQNPDGVSAIGLVYDFMGTVYSDDRELDECESNPPADVTVEIIDADGGVAVTLTPDFAGNFYSGRNSGVALPYTARVRRGANVNAMLTPQTEGDCNTCHTVTGLTGAPGRIVWPQ